ncbi:MAG TPA: pseudouridine synthase [Parafilimonas sp.]|nr:pseudouridine synthase [Parafilimonas sp.]
MKQHAFDKFVNKEKGAKKKEAIRQEKRKWKQEKRNKYDEAQTREKAARKKPVDRMLVSSSRTDPRLETSNRNFKTEHKKQADKIPDPKSRRQAGEVRHQASGIRHQRSSEMPLNKFISHAGICSRREAAELVKEGKVKVNNEVISEPGFKVTENDKISVNQRQVHLRKNLVYILLNKPKDYITTVKDPQGRKTIFQLIKNAADERIFPVGRLDRNTTGVLLLTNDGELTQKLTHPSFGVKKIYEVRLDRPLEKRDMEKILQGITLEDGPIVADAIGYADMKDKAIIGIEIHSGRNRIVRRMFEHLGYDVKNLDRVLFANLTKKNVERGKWRYLTEKEIRLLKYMNQSFIKRSRAGKNESI